MPMKDGFRTLITFPSSPALPITNFAEVTVKPPGITGRGPIDITSMRNVVVTTKWPKALHDYSNLTSSVQWDPLFFGNIRDFILLKNQLIRVTFPTGRAIRFYGWADGFEPNAHREGEVPLADLTIVLSNLRAEGGIVPIVFEQLPVLE